MSQIDQNEQAFAELIEHMLANREDFWTAKSLYDFYLSKNGQQGRHYLFTKLSNYFGKDFIILSSPGIVNIVAFRNRATNVLHLVNADDDDDENELNQSIHHVAEQIVKETKDRKPKTDIYYTRMDIDIAKDYASPTLLRLLTEICDDFEGQIGLFGGNMVTSQVTSRPTPLHVALSVAVKEKNLIELLHDFGITCSYDEYRLFRISAAKSASQARKREGIFQSESGLVQVVAVNFDANISSQNGLMSTHALAMLVTQNIPQSAAESTIDNSDV